MEKTDKNKGVHDVIGADTNLACDQRKYCQGKLFEQR